MSGTVQFALFGKFIICIICDLKFDTTARGGYLGRPLAVILIDYWPLEMANKVDTFFFAIAECSPCLFKEFLLINTPRRNSDLNVFWKQIGLSRGMKNHSKI